MSESERREHERFELLARVALDHGPVATFVTINISAGGLLLRNDAGIALEVGKRIRISFDAPELAPAFTIDATVVRVIASAAKPGLVAAMWSSSDTAANAALGQILWNLRRPETG
jgi:c-di-GMP-binding flagellar brake protein YcgR